MLRGTEFHSSGLEIHSQFNGIPKDISMQIMYKFHGKKTTKIVCKIYRNLMEIRHLCHLNGMEFSTDHPSKIYQNVGSQGINVW